MVWCGVGGGWRMCGCEIGRRTQTIDNRARPTKMAQRRFDVCHWRPVNGTRRFDVCHRRRCYGTRRFDVCHATAPDGTRRTDVVPLTGLNGTRRLDVVPIGVCAANFGHLT